MTLEIIPVKDPEAILSRTNGFTERETHIMREAMKASTYMWIVEWNGELVAFWGVIPITLSSSTVYLWFYTLPELKGCALAFARKSREVTTATLGVYDKIIGHCVESALASHRWLRWCGATFGEPFHGAIPFEIKAG